MSGAGPRQTASASLPIQRPGTAAAQRHRALDGSLFEEGLKQQFLQPPTAATCHNHHATFPWETFKISFLKHWKVGEMRNLFLILVAGMLATGCSHMQHQAMTAKDLADLRNQTVVRTSAPVPSFVTLKFFDERRATISAKIPMNDDILIRSAGVEDPAVSISATLAASLAVSNGARILPQQISVTGNEVRQIADAARSSARYVLDVRTFSWLVTYLPLAWNSYGLAYVATARLIDTQTNTVVAQGYCNQNFDKTIDPPTFEGMMANRAARLKRELDLTAEACTNIFSTQMSLGTPGPMVRSASTAVAQQAPPATSTLRQSVDLEPARPVAPVMPQATMVLQQPPQTGLPAEPVTRPLDAYEMALAEIRARNNRLNPDSVYYNQDAFDWVMARQAEHMKKGLAAPDALRRAVDNMERP
jgi:hypothetical protein